MSRRRLSAAAIALLGAVASFPALTFATSAHASAPKTIGARSGVAPGAEIFAGTDAQVNQELDLIAASGAHYIRLDFAWSWVQPDNASTWDWSAIDRVVDGALARGLQIDALATYAPSWETGQSGDKHAPARPQDFYNFVYQAGLRYVPKGVNVWEMWNEPNLATFMGQTSPATYTSKILVPGSQAIRAAAAHLGTSVTVLSGGLAPAVSDGTDIAPRDFLAGMYAAHAHGTFDGVGLHPYSWPYAPMTAGAWNTFANTPALYQIMVNNGDAALKVWGTEWGYPTGSCSGCVSEGTQASMIQLAYRQWNQWSFTGPLFLYSFHDGGADPGDPEANFGVTRHDFSSKPGLSAFNQEMAVPLPGAGPTPRPSPSVPSTVRAPGATHVLAPNRIVSVSDLVGSVGDLASVPTGRPPSHWLTRPDPHWGTSLVVGFPTPKPAPNPGAAQRFQVRVRKTSATGQNPTVCLSWLQRGVVEGKDVVCTPVTSATGQVVSMSVSMANLPDKSGANIELRSWGELTPDGTSVEVGAVAWTVA